MSQKGVRFLDGDPKNSLVEQKVFLCVLVRSKGLKCPSAYMSSHCPFIVTQAVLVQISIRFFF